MLAFRAVSQMSRLKRSGSATRLFIISWVELNAAENALRKAATERFGHIHRQAQPRKSFWWRR